MAKEKGYDFLIFITSGSTKQPIAGSKTCSFDSKKGSIDTSSRDGKSFIVDEEEYTLSCDGVVDFTISGTSFTTVYSLYQAETEITWAFGSSTNSNYMQTLNTGKKYFSGTGLITDCKVSSNFTGTVEYSLTIKGIGNSALN